MQSRRRFLRSGLGAVAAGLLARRNVARAGGQEPGLIRLPSIPLPAECATPGALPQAYTRPFANLPLSMPSVTVGGMPFSPRFTGDDYAFADFPFHTCQNCFPANRPPDPTEEVDVAIVGGGLSGLATAYLLRDRRPMVFELKDRFGGVSAGETWGGIPFSLGGAYFITPDEGSFLESLYRELGLPDVARVDTGDFEVERGGMLDQDFFAGSAFTKEEREAVARYVDVVRGYTEEYPEIPVPDGDAGQWIRDLDRKTLKQDIENKMGVPVPTMLAQAIQAYCYSSFGAGWESLSAAGGWNFLAAEEFGRWVLPGGNAYLVDQLWQRLSGAQGLASTCPPARMMGRCRVVDVRFAEPKRMQVTYLDADGQFRSVLARKVVMCCSKMIAKYILHDLHSIDPQKHQAMHNIEYAAYAVANVLLDRPLQQHFYDVFLLGNGDFPMTPAAFEADSRVTDMLSGHFAQTHRLPRSVLTLYWPLPWASARFTLLDDNAWHNYAESLAPQVRDLLTLVNLPESAVRQVRLTRWGHAMPVSRPNFIADGSAAHLRRPIEGLVWFVNQDNWALPAVENCLQDAEWVAAEVGK